MRFLLPLVLALVLLPTAATALPPPPALLGPVAVAGGGTGRQSAVVCGTDVAAALEGRREVGDHWRLTLHVATPPNVVLGTPCPLAFDRTFAGPLVLSEGGCVAASDGGGDWLCLDSLGSRVDLAVHVDVCYRIAPCAHHLTSDLHLVAA